jgi:hypothetical protein
MFAQWMVTMNLRAAPWCSVVLRVKCLAIVEPDSADAIVPSDDTACFSGAGRY